MSESSPAAVLEVQSLRVRSSASPLSVSVAPGEILGVVGLEGHGQEEFLKAMCGLVRPFDGVILMRGPDGTQSRITSFPQAASLGVGYVPRDRKTEGIFAPLSVFDNFAIVVLPRLSRLGVPRRRAIRVRYQALHDRLAIVTPSMSAPIAALSGGNQQKVVLARWMAAGPKVLLLNDPTRGVDLATRRTLYEFLRSTASEGAALVVLSTELEELLELCGRVLVFREASVVAELNRSELTMATMIAAMFGRAHA